MGIATSGLTNTRQTLRDEAWAAASPPSLSLDIARESAIQPARRSPHRWLMAAAAIVAIAAAWAATNGRSGGPLRPVPPAPALPQPVGEVMTLYRFAVESGPAEVVMFFDTRGRWCRATWFDHEAWTASHYRCRTTALPRDGFGRVDTVGEMPTWDGHRLWVQGVVTDDIARVTVTYRDGAVATAHLLREAFARAAVFTVARPYVSPPQMLRAYNARGRLVQTLSVQAPSPLPWTAVP